MIKSLNKSIEVSKIDSKLGIIELEERNEMSILCPIDYNLCPINFSGCPVDSKVCYFNYGITFPPKCLAFYA